MNRFLIILMSTAIAACNAIPNATLITVQKPLGTLQCQDNDNTEHRFIQLSTQLKEAEIKIASAAISHDGLSRPTVCGAADGKIGLFKIPSTQLQQAQQLGYSLRESD